MKVNDYSKFAKQTKTKRQTQNVCKRYYYLFYNLSKKQSWRCQLEGVKKTCEKWVWKRVQNCVSKNGAKG